MRDLDTYRGARRNACLRKDHAIWGPSEYYGGHKAGARARRLSRAEGARVVRTAGRSGPAKPRVAVRAPSINKAAPRGT